VATLLSSIITNARYTLDESTAVFWSDAELLVYAIDGVRDLWRAILDLNQGHFVVIDDSNVSLAANSSSLDGVPTDVFRVETLELRDLTTAGVVQGTTFEPRRLNDADFQSARSLGAVDAGGQQIFYSLLNAGAPIGAPTIEIAPQVTSAIDLRLVYTKSLGTLTSGDNNPIPGDSDHAIQAWVVAHALAKERDDRKPHPEWLAVYASDKKNLLTALTPRQVQEPEVAEALFEAWSWQ
jgi:hypothetical protein